MGQRHREHPKSLDPEFPGVQALLEIMPVGADLFLETRLCGRRTVGFKDKVESVGFSWTARIFEGKKGVRADGKLINALVVQYGHGIIQFPTLLPIGKP